MSVVLPLHSPRQESVKIDNSAGRSVLFGVPETYPFLYTKLRFWACEMGLFCVIMVDD